MWEVVEVRYGRMRVWVGVDVARPWACVRLRTSVLILVLRYARPWRCHEFDRRCLRAESTLMLVSALFLICLFVIMPLAPECL